MSGGEVAGEREGEVAEHLDVLVLERREALEVFVGDLETGGSEICDRVVKALGVPEHERVEREAERAQLVFLPSRYGWRSSPWLPWKMTWATE